MTNKIRNNADYAMAYTSLLHMMNVDCNFIIKYSPARSGRVKYKMPYTSPWVNGRELNYGYVLFRHSLKFWPDDEWTESRRNVENRNTVMIKRGGNRKLNLDEKKNIYKMRERNKENVFNMLCNTNRNNNYLSFTRYSFYFPSLPSACLFIYIFCYFHVSFARHYGCLFIQNIKLDKFKYGKNFDGWKFKRS